MSLCSVQLKMSQKGWANYDMLYLCFTQCLSFNKYINCYNKINIIISPLVSSGPALMAAWPAIWTITLKHNEKEKKQSFSFCVPQDLSFQTYWRGKITTHFLGRLAQSGSAIWGKPGLSFVSLSSMMSAVGCWWMLLSGIMSCSSWPRGCTRRIALISVWLRRGQRGKLL